MTERLHLLPRHRAQLEALLNEHLPDVEVWAYGSRVNGQSHDGSDLDLVLRGPGLQEIDLDALADFSQALHDSTIPFLVEARDWARLPERFHREIEREYVALKRGDQPLGVNEVAQPADRCPRPREPWPSLRLGNCVETVRQTYRATDGWSFINYLDTGSITEGRIEGIQHLIVGEDKIPSRARRRVRSGDIVYSTVRPNQRHFGLLKRKLPENFLASTGFCVMRGRPGMADTEYVYWFLSQESVVGHLQTVAEHSTSAYPSIRASDLENLEIAVPPLAEQRSIADILGTLDDKIELNRRMNDTLEAMARALFKSWFVDFDPVRAKMEGRDTGLPQGIANLFPDRLVDSELGEIPEGWAAVRLGEIADSKTQGVDPSSVASNTPYIGLADMPRGSIALADWGETGSATSRKFAFGRGDILFGKLRPYFHKVGIAPVDGLCSTDIVVVVPRRPEFYSFVLACVSSAGFVAHTSQAATGTRMPRTSWRAMSRYPLCLPAESAVSAFHGIVSPALSRIVDNVHEFGTLAALRDTLLPKLVSGEIRVQDAESLAPTSSCAQ